MVPAINEIIEKFIDFYVCSECDRLLSKEDIPSTSFDSFINLPGNEAYRSAVSDYARAKGTTINRAVFEELTDEQRKSIGSCFQAVSQDVFIESPQQMDALETKVLTAQEVRDLRKIAQFLTEEQRERLAAKIVNLKYAALDDETKELLDPRIIKMYIMNMGFIRLPASNSNNHREAFIFIKQYKSLFSGEEDVVNHILSRYIDEELSVTPPCETAERIKTLQKDVEEIYEGLK
jgi:hypothetical protein